jgi:hypothetical protein
MMKNNSHGCDSLRLDYEIFYVQPISKAKFIDSSATSTILKGFPLFRLQIIDEFTFNIFLPATGTTNIVNNIVQFKNVTVKRIKV